MAQQPSTHALLGLLQISDSLFPSGAFAHSYGLEQLARDGRIRDAGELERFVSSLLELTLATSDAVAVARAAEAAGCGDVAGLVATDCALLRTKPATELRAASLATGRRLVEETVVHVPEAMLEQYAVALRADRNLGLHPVAFGAVCARLGLEANAIVPAYLLGAVTAILQAAMRLLPVSHRDVQSILHRLRPRIAFLAEQVSRDQPLAAFSPVQEIALMRHASAEVRLFSS